MKTGVFFAIVLALCGNACNHRLQTREAVEKAVWKEVARSGITPDRINMTVTRMDFHGKAADVKVSFVPKGGRLSEGMTLPYKLEQRGEEWVVVGKGGINIQQHAGGMQAPPSTMDGNSGAVDPIPQAAPGTVPSSRPLPPGHPPISGNGK